ncbi:MAG: class I SAM-dependent methyltransferase [Verrucomicrobiales bacterium]
MGNKEKQQRTTEQLRNHFEVERELAGRLRNSSRGERPSLFPVLYDELFERVPDHPRLVRRDAPEKSSVAVAARLRLLQPHLDCGFKFLEFAAGDCRLAYEVCSLVENVIAVDISDQRSSADIVPDNFSLIIYDGYNLDVPDVSVDIVFSYQFLEHLHPEDVGSHFENAARVLKEGGMYVFDTPHRFSGPHDISRHFGNKLECFHFQEWTYREMFELLNRHGFSCNYIYAGGEVRKGSFLNGLCRLTERLVAMLPRRLSKIVSARVFRSVTMMAVKG